MKRVAAMTESSRPSSRALASGEPGRLLLALLVASLGLLSAGAAGCVEDEEQEVIELDEAVLSETGQSLSALNWSATSIVDASMNPAQVATLGNRVFIVNWRNGGLFWRERTGGVNWWSAEAQIPGLQSAYVKPSLAAFNGYLYMIYVERIGGRLSVTRFNPSTNTWSSSYSISHSSFGGPPAMVAYNGVLQLIGVDATTKKLWRSTMSTSEAFSAPVPMEGHYSYSRVSAAVQDCKLHIVHRAGGGTTVVHNFFNGTGWTYDRTIPAGRNGAAIQAYEPVIAERAGYLHLIHRDLANGAPNADAPVWWTYYNGVSWPSATTLPGGSFANPSLSTGGSGLIALTGQSSNNQGTSMEYYQPLPLLPPRPCIAPPILQ